MGRFSFRGKSSDRPIEATEDRATTTGSDVLPEDTDAAATEADLRKFRKLHQWDPFLEVEKLDVVDEVIETGDVEKEAAIEESLIEEDSPYPEVRASVSCLFLLHQRVQDLSGTQPNAQLGSPL